MMRCWKISTIKILKKLLCHLVKKCKRHKFYSYRNLATWQWQINEYCKDEHCICYITHNFVQFVIVGDKNAYGCDKLCIGKFKVWRWLQILFQTLNLLTCYLFVVNTIKVLIQCSEFQVNLTEVDNVREHLCI